MTFGDMDASDIVGAEQFAGRPVVLPMPRLRGVLDRRLVLTLSAWDRVTGPSQRAADRQAICAG